MNITHMVFALGIGGAESMLVDILNEQVKQDPASNFELIIVNKKYDPFLIKQLNSKVKITYFNRKEGSKNPLPILKLNHYIRRSKADILHCHDHNIMNTLFSVKKKRILTVHSIVTKGDVEKKYDVLCAISRAVKKDIKKRGSLDSELIYNGIRISDITTKKRSITQNNDYKLIQVSRLDHIIKGQDILLHAIKHISTTNPDLNISVDFIGEGNSLQYLQDLSSTLGLEKRVNFRGAKNRDYIYSHLCEYDLLVQPSIYEGFGLTVTEGMAANIPVLVSDNYGPMEIIENGKYGFHFKSGDAKDCANQILNVMNHPNIKEITDMAHTRVCSNFDITATARKYLDLYKKIIENR